MATNDYIESSRWHTTASKLKTYKISPKLYELIFEKELAPLIEEDEGAFMSWTALHYILEKWEEAFLEKYWISDWFLKDELKDQILERIRHELKEHGKDEMDITFELEAHKKRLSKTWVNLPHLREEFYGSKQRSTIKDKIAMTPTEGEMVMGMYRELKRQPIMDLDNKFTKEQTIKAIYYDWDNEISIWIKPDRLCIYQIDDEWYEIQRWTIDEYEEIVNDLSLDQRVDYAKKNWIRGIFRDRKSSQSIAKMRKELLYDRETAFGYVFSMAHYFTVLYIATWIQFQGVLDVVEKQAPYITDAISLPPTFLYEKMVHEVEPTLSKLLKSKINNDYPEPTREEILNSKALSKYYTYFTSSVQDWFNYINDMLVDMY